MNQANPYQSPHQSYQNVAAQADLIDRLGFIRRTYLHLTGAILILIGLEFCAFQFFEPQLASFGAFVFQSQFVWLGMLGAFMAVSWVADSWARNGGSRGKQYLGLTLYVLAEAVILAPLLWYANFKAPGAIQSAAIITGFVFVGLTAIVFITGQDFSFLRNFLMIGGLMAFAGMIALMFVPQMIGVENLKPINLLFSVAMVGLAAGCILYKTSNVLHHYYTDQHVAASLALFSSIALMFWYVLRLVMSRE